MATRGGRWPVVILALTGAALGLLIGWEAWDVTRRFELDVQPWAGPSGGGVQIARNF